MLPLLLLFTTLRNSNGADINKLCKENINGDTNKYDLSPLGTKVYKVEDSSGWVYHFALCGESNIDLGNDLKNDAILQTGNGEQHVVATKIISRHGGDEWVQLVFGEGDKYNNHCNKQARKAQILFICDPNVDGNDVTKSGSDFAMCLTTLLSFFKKRFRKKLFYKKLLKCKSHNSGTPQQNKTPLTCLKKLVLFLACLHL
eukprot:sb/3470649/